MAKPKAVSSTRTRTAASAAPARRKAAPAARAAAPKAASKPKARAQAVVASKPVKPAKPAPAGKTRAVVAAKPQPKPKTAAAPVAPPPPKPARPVAAAAKRGRTPERRPTARPRVARVKPPAQDVAKEAAVPSEWPAVGEQERVGALKFGSRPAPRGIDEQRFLFPRNYEINRVRLVVRDPEWLFAYWDVNPRAFEGLRREMGERIMALSRLTLKVADPDGSHAQIILLPYGARSWYVRVEAVRRRYVAELGITLPSGQFRALAQSNVVALPRIGPSPQGAERSIGFHEAWAAQGELATGVADAESLEPSSWVDPGTSIRPGAGERGGASDRLSAETAARRDELGRDARIGGASDLYRR